MTWWSYGPRDFLMFAPRTYWRLIELYNQALWPWQLALLGAGGALLWHAARHGSFAGRTVCAALALAWLWVAWGWQWQQYATINWGSRYLAAASVLQAALLLAVALRGHREPRADPTEWARRTGLMVALAGVVLYPLATAAAGASWARAELAGAMPEATALATLGLLMTVQPRQWQWLIVLPLLSLVLGATTLCLLVTR